MELREGGTEGPRGSERARKADSLAARSSEHAGCRDCRRVGHSELCVSARREQGIGVRMHVAKRARTPRRSKCRPSGRRLRRACEPVGVAGWANKVRRWKGEGKRVRERGGRGWK
eukprot:6187988-Pleurochrysis_carterae.AAC.1